MRRRTFLCAGAAALATPLAAWSQALPTGPIRIIVGFPPGGGTDVMARVIAQQLSALWRVSVIVENRPGAAGVVAAEYTARQAPDGATLLMTNISNHAIAPSLYPKLGYSVEKDFTPVMLVGVTPNLLICHTGGRARSVADVVALCRSQPGKITFGSSGAGAAQHLALEMFKLRAGVEALHVPYRGSAPMLTDLIGGQIDFSFETMTSATPQIQGGKVVAIAQTRPRRAASYPNVPTLAESGFPGFDAGTWYGLVGPAGLPAPMVQRMNADLNKVLALPDVAGKLAGFGAEDGGGSAARFAQFIATERAKWARVVKDANVKV
ncbi:Bug family tripartite tricarboxylate transporter substrate binding protein [Cupriavidus oxalaticus]|jgi:tripartite-type tricarboxylate transporter receptor subunit TctC|uniref:Tripartite tricarboxylate transporter substrate binding protein n=1 Tax=Cupriavidus oxalaticus TaxID=96344 RepID=A0ABX7HQH5_9BURK|nr:tripartite tricarboxylate transporter substrate binding protein [Cupriavidus oxalaticus]QRQ88938.1 tripartite tricarboxylate transporter substrate binding protein [Cupriavidus oxalaticus]QRQ92736.1 tripartite tricarboxylate transporter substrate binding protein [Cupriavidus oxalaticus]WQD81340.1 tripartite tricarboxylate transporter substrate binding protein [Cupriavidus oxalaticus]